MKVLSFHRTFYEALCCTVSDEQLFRWADWMSDWIILCLSMTNTCQHTDVTGYSLEFQCQLFQSYLDLADYQI